MKYEKNYSKKWMESSMVKNNRKLVDYSFLVSCNDYPNTLINLIWYDDDIEGAMDLAKTYYFHNHTIYADDRNNNWSIILQ